MFPAEPAVGWWLFFVCASLEPEGSTTWGFGVCEAYCELQWNRNSSEGESL